MSGAERVHRIDAGGVTLAVTEFGSGPPLAFLHGFTGCAESMAGIARSLAPRFRTLRIDLVGHGGSESPRDPAAYAMEACCEQLVRTLDALDLRSAHWLGYSMGGRTLLSLACAHPERVRSALLVGASAGIADPDQRSARAAADEALAQRIERDGVEAFVDEWMALPLFASQKRLGEDALRAARVQRLANRPHGLANSLRGMGTAAQPPLHDELAALHCRVCFAVGEEDVKFRAVAEALVVRLPDARVAIVPEAGHAAHLENPGFFAALAERFFEGAEQTGGGCAPPERSARP